jgi:1,4-dihydroxy-2-naphthoate octaprenyltransferase
MDKKDMRTKQLTVKEWLVVWAKAARAPFLIVSFLPAALGGAVAWLHGALEWTPFLIAVLGVVMAHSAADFFDDYYDYKSGNLGNKEKQFHDSPLISGEVTVSQVMLAALLCLAVALACGVYLFLRAPAAVLWMTLIGAFIVFFYTAPPVRLNYRGLGELMLFFAFGPLIVLGVYWVVTGRFDWAPVIAGIAPGMLTMNVGIVSNIFDHDDDVRSGKFTMPARFGRRVAVNVLGASAILAYVSLVLGAAFGLLPVYALIALFTLPLTIQTVRASTQYHDLSRYTGAMTKAIAAASLVGALLILAYALAVLM